jgi:hypothetical protein
MDKPITGVEMAATGTLTEARTAQRLAVDKAGPVSGAIKALPTNARGKRGIRKDNFHGVNSAHTLYQY